MTKSIKEISKKAEDLIEQGREADQNVSNCQSRVVVAANNVAAARRQLAIASMTDEDGYPMGDVAAAQAQLNMAQNQLAASERALETAQSQSENIRRQKQSQVSEISRHNQTSKSNLEKIRRLKSLAFGENADALEQGMVDRINEAEDSRVRLLESMGMEVAPDYVEAEDAATSVQFREATIRSMDVSGQPQSHEGGNGGGGGASEGMSSNGGIATPVGGGLSSGMNNGAQPDSAQAIDKVQTIDADNSITASRLADAASAYEKILADEALSPAEKAQALRDLKASLQNMSQLEICKMDVQNQRAIAKTLVLKMPDDERYNMGLSYVNDMLDIHRANLRDMGVCDGEAMERHLAVLQSEYLKSLSTDIKDGTVSLYFLPDPDYGSLAEKIKADYSKYPPQSVINAKQREQLREGIRNGTITEKEVRSIGQKVRERYDQMLSEKHQAIDEIEKERFDLAVEYKMASTKQEKEAIKLRKKLLLDRENELYAKYDNLEIMKNVVSQFRSVGPSSDADVQPYQSGPLRFGTGKVVEAIDNVRNYIPTDWVQKSNGKPIDVRRVSRGYFLPGNTSDTVALSGGSRHMKSCAFHEMGHRFENMYPEILTIEKQFYDRRTAGEQLTWLGPGYEKTEVTRFDNFISPYMGKDYGGDGYELLSMGLEGIYCGTFNISRDPEYENLILGILTTI